MCPSFMATREEADSTRGRAHLLFEMLQGEAITAGWHDEQIKDALDQCLACKACKSECPVNVDMATYKAEFLAHYYAGKVRPASAYAMGLIYWWARLAAHAPGLVNGLTHAPGLRRLVLAVGGIAPQRQVPTFAPETFTHWFQQRGLRNVGGPPVLLWPDTFNNHFHPATAIAAVEVLEAAGFQITVPTQSLCCGRPLYDVGMLTTAKRLLRQILTTLHPQLVAGMPIVVLEPSCAAVFRDELGNLFPDDPDARLLAQQTFLLSEFLEHHAPDYQPPQLRGQALIQGHCHHKSIMKLTDEEHLLTKLGLDCQLLDSGCCGMAGAFGFAAEHYDVSIACGERVLLPAVRAATPETLIIADGFSCREQIAQTTNRRALHLAEVLQMALYRHPDDAPQSYPERHAPSQPRSLPAMARTAVAIGAGVGATLATAAWLRRHIPRRKQRG